MANDRLMSPVSFPVTWTSRSENTAVSALRSLGATSRVVVSPDGVVVTLPKRTGSVLGCGFDAGFVAGLWPGWVALPPGFPAAFGEPVFCPVCCEDAAGERNDPGP